VKRLREEQGLSGEDLAEAVAAQGVHLTRSILANYENGTRPYLTLVEAAAIAVALGVYLADLLVGEEETSDRAVWTAPFAVDADGRHAMTARELRGRLGGKPMPAKLIFQVQEARDALDAAWDTMFGPER
jgi:transcriptional regulator with XRE-family HTH domain